LKVRQSKDFAEAKQPRALINCNSGITPGLMRSNFSRSAKSIFKICAATAFWILACVGKSSGALVAASCSSL
jgi:hypothetical protein